MIKMLEHLSYDNKLRGWEFFHLEKRRLRGGLITNFQYLKRGHNKSGDKVFVRECSDKLRKRNEKK